MLGTFGTSAYKSEQDFKTPQDYLKYMFEDIDGFATRSTIRHSNDGITSFLESFYKHDRLIYKNRYFNCPDTYISMNTYCSKRNDKKPESGRKVSNVKRLNALYVDLDCYKIGMTQEQVLFALEEDCFGHSIPVPTFVINSGRGLYLIWKLKNEDRNALPRWESVEEYLFSQCRDFNADPQALDAARILRVPFTVNSNNNASVSIMRFTDVSYTLYEISQEFSIKATAKKYKDKNPERIVHPYGEATERQRQIATLIADEKGLKLPDFSNYKATFDFIAENPLTHREEKRNNVVLFAKAKNIYTMLDGRCKDLFRLFSMRKGKDCCREYALFLCRLWTSERTNDFQKAIDVTMSLNASFDVPFTEDYVMTRTKSAEKKIKSGKTYYYSTKKIIMALNITTEEQEQLTYLCHSQCSEKIRRKKNNRKTYLMRLEKNGVETKKNTVSKRREHIAALLADGKNKNEICAALHISTRTYDRDKAAIVASGLLERVRDGFKAARDIVAATAENAVAGLSAALKRTPETARNIFKTIQRAVSPNIKSTYYKRTAIGCSACAGDLDTPVAVQLALWDCDIDTS
ncbi:replication protein (plasmid) [Oscillibacter valericigenes Sjm18-20]|nr:replication protein [Oscillibacter valericigenes Sjm18-20]